MPGPWEQFQQPREEGPWSQFAAAAPPAALAPRNFASPQEALAAQQRGELQPEDQFSIGGKPVIPGTNLEWAARPPAPSPSFGQRVEGALEAALTTVTGATGGTLGLAKGVIGGLIDTFRAGEYGTQRGASRVERAATEGAAQLTYEPRTETGREYAGAVGEAMSVLPPVIGVAPTGVRLPPRELATAPVRGVAGALRDVVPAGRRAVAEMQGPIPAAIERGAQEIAQRAPEVRARLEAPERQAVENALAAGFKLPPTAAKGGVAGRAAQTLAGSARLRKEMSAHNADVAAKFVRDDLGLLEDVPLTREATDSIRRKAAEDYPDLAGNPIIKRVQALRDVKEANTGSAIEVVKDLRNEASKAYRAGDKKLGGAFRDVAQAVDNSMDRALGRMAEKGAPELADAVGKYREARVRIAKAYLADDAMTGKPGEINPNVYGRVQRKNPKLLTGGARTVGEFAAAFVDEGLTQPKGRTGELGSTGFDLLMGALHMPAGGAAALAALTGRPLVRAALGSEAAQRRLRQRNLRELEQLALEEAPPPMEPTLERGFEPAPQRPTEPSPLGDLTPEWETAPGATPQGAPLEVVPTEGLVPALGEQPPTTGRRRAPLAMEPVLGRPDLPETMIAGGPAEVAATEAAGRAMQTPEAALARQQQGVATAPADPRLAKIDQALETADSDAVREVLRGRRKAVEKTIRQEEVSIKRANDLAALEQAAKATDDLELKADFPKKADALREEKIPIGEATELETTPTPAVRTPKRIPVGEATEVSEQPLTGRAPEQELLPVGEAREITRSGVELTEVPAVGEARELYVSPEKRNAPEQVTQQEGLREQPEGRAQKRAPEETGAGDRVQRAKEGGREAEGERQQDLGLPNISETFMQAETDRRQGKAPLTERGTAQVRKALEEGRDNGSLDKDGADLALWMLSKNPALGRRLKLRVVEGEGGARGDYEAAVETIRIFKNVERDPHTAAHEILHHTERMMPERIRTGIQKEWNHALQRAITDAEGLERELLADIPKALRGDKAAQQAIMRAFNGGILKRNTHYQLVNPSEFWAVNGPRILQERFTGRGSWRAEAKQWIKEMIEHIKGTIGLRSDAPVLKALDELLNPERTAGERRSERDLSRS